VSPSTFFWCLRCRKIIRKTHKKSAWRPTWRMQIGSHDTNKTSANLQRKPPLLRFRNTGSGYGIALAYILECIRDSKGIQTDIYTYVVTVNQHDCTSPNTVLCQVCAISKLVAYKMRYTLFHMNFRLQGPSLIDHLP